jgi:hypothetical protein
LRIPSRAAAWPWLAHPQGTDLDPLDALWHLINLFAPALGVGFLASALAKLLWRGELRRVAWLRLGSLASGVAAAVLLGGLVLLGHDGRIATYAAMVAATALSLWWFGFRAPVR